MTYCVGIKLRAGLVMGSDSRTHAEVDNFATFCKMSVFERVGERVLILLSSGSLAGTQAVITLLRQRTSEAAPHVFSAKTMFDVATLVADAMREVGKRDGAHVHGRPGTFSGSFILGGQIRGDEMRLFRLYAEGNFIEAGTDTPFFQTGEAKYGKPIIDRVITPETTLADAAKCVVISFDSTIRSNMSVGPPIDVACYERDSLVLTMRRRLQASDDDFVRMRKEWAAGALRVFRELPELDWSEADNLPPEAHAFHPTPPPPIVTPPKVTATATQGQGQGQIMATSTARPPLGPK